MFRAVPSSSAAVVLAITGASGAPYAVRLLETLASNHVPTWLLVSAHGWRLLNEECGIKDEAALKQATGGDWGCVRAFNDADRGAEPASGSVKTLGMVVCPCSMGTLAAIAHGTSRSLIERAADVTLKVVMPAAPGFYQRPKEIGQLVDFIVQRIVDQLGLEIRLIKPWQG